MGPLNLFFAVNDAYAQHCCVTMTSILEHNRDLSFEFYVLTDYISEDNRRKIGSLKTSYGNCEVHFQIVDDAKFSGLKLNIAHISQHTYYRYAIAELFPQLDKALYLDVDLVVNGSLAELWKTDLSGFLCAGVADLWIDKIHYKPEIGFELDELYVNAGVLLLNLEQMRREGLFQKLCDVTRELEARARFQDQDIINIVCRGRIKELPEKYNFAAYNVKAHPEQHAEAIVIHYTGVRKPWAPRRCGNSLKRLYFENLAKTPYRYAKYGWMFRRVGCLLTPKFLRKKSTPPLRVALIVDEFFGGAGTAYGGYGFLARHLISKYIPCDNIKIDVLIGRGHGSMRAVKTPVDNVCLYRLPARRFIAGWLKKKNYDLYLSVEMTIDILHYEGKSKTPLLLWVQDPRPWTDWLEIQSVKLFPEKNYWNTRIYETVHRIYTQNRVTFVTQARCLIDKARSLYRLSTETPISYLPNPIDVAGGFDAETCPKKNSVIFIGRIASVKRTWLFCEIAKRMPEYDFYVVGASLIEKQRNDEIMDQYRSGIPNLHFTGHLEGDEKLRYIRESKVLVNTSIHEALPVTFLEALTCGTLLVSCQNPDELASRFGIYTGPVLGDGYDKVDLFVDAIRTLITDEEWRRQLAAAACEYVSSVHDVGTFIRNTRSLIRETAVRQ